MLVKNMTNSRLDVWVQGGKKKVILAGEIVDLPSNFIDTGAGKHLKRQNKIAVIEGKDQPGSADDKKFKPKKNNSLRRKQWLIYRPEFMLRKCQAVPNR